MFKRIFTILAATLVMCSAAYCFEPLNTEAVTSLEIKYKYDTTDISGAEFKLYKVADVSTYVSYTATPQFSKYAVSFKDMKDDGGKALAATLAAYADKDNLAPLATGTTGNSGTTKFSELKTGLYLVSSPTCSYNGYYYRAEPFLVCLPNYVDTKWQNDVTASPKVSREKIPSSGGGGHVPDPRIDIGVLIVWENDDESKRPDNVDVQLYKDDLLYNSHSVKLSEGWHYTWSNLPQYGDYNVLEEKVPEGYTITVERDGNVFIITHKGEGTPAELTTEATTQASEEATAPPSDEPTPSDEPAQPPVIQEPVVSDSPEPTTEDPLSSMYGRGGRTGAGTTKDGEDDEPNVPGLPGSTGGTGSRTGAAGSGGNGLPQTGQLKWPVPIMATSGLLIFLIGFIRHKEQEIKLSDSKNQ